MEYLFIAVPSRSILSRSSITWLGSIYESNTTVFDLNCEQSNNKIESLEIEFFMI